MHTPGLVLSVWGEGAKGVLALDPPLIAHTKWSRRRLRPQYRMYQEGQHFTARRFFPLDYIKAVLALKESMQVTMETSVDDIIEHFDDRVNYDAMHADCYAQVERSHTLLANWRSEDFELTLEGDGSIPGSTRTKTELIAADKGIIQNYGRPYTPDGKPSGTYYKYARTERVPEWLDIDSKRFSQSLLQLRPSQNERDTSTTGSNLHAPHSGDQQRRWWEMLLGRRRGDGREPVSV